MKSTSYDSSIAGVAVIIIALIVAAAAFLLSRPDNRVLCDVNSDKLAIENARDSGLRNAPAGLYGTELENTSLMFNEAM